MGKALVGHSSCVLRAIYVAVQNGARVINKLLPRNNRTLPSPVDDLLLEL